MRWMVFLYSQRNINGLVLTLIVGVVALFFQNFSQMALYLPLFYLLGVLITPEPLSGLRARPSRSSAKTLGASSGSFEHLSRLSRLPGAVRVRLERLQSLLDQLEGYSSMWKRDAIGPRTYKTLNGFLPQTLLHYTQLPTLYARLHPLQDGRTARSSLLHTLEWLEESLTRMVQLAQESDFEALRLELGVLEEICSRPLRFLR